MRTTTAAAPELAQKHPLLPNHALSASRGRIEIQFFGMWRLRLAGDELGFRRLAAEVPDGAESIVFERSGDYLLLSAPAVETAPSAKEALDAGIEILDRLQFGITLKWADHKPIPRPSTVIDATGKAHHFGRGQAHVTMTVSANLTVSGPEPAMRRRTPGELVLLLAPIVPEVDRAMKFWEEGRTPELLHKVLEIVQSEDANDRCKAKQMMTEKPLNRFTGSVNHPSVFGAAAARHAVLNTEPPRNPMTLAEAEDFISVLVRKWLECLAEANGIALTVPNAAAR